MKSGESTVVDMLELKFEKAVSVSQCGSHINGNH